MKQTRTISICTGGPKRRIKVGKRSYLFEMHSHCGPLPCDHLGNERVVPDGSKFWTAVSQWAQQGEKADESGNCVYDPSTPMGATQET